MTYLITGGAGNLARQLAHIFGAHGIHVVLFDIADQPSDLECQYVRGDLTCPQDLVQALQTFRPEVVLHMASLLSGRCEQDRNQGWQINVTATFTLFETLLSHGVKRIFFPSLLATYGGSMPDLLPPDHPQWPVGLYGVTKATCERLGHYYHEAHGLDFRCLRLPMVISRFDPPGAASAYASRAFVETVANGSFTFKVRPTTACATAYVADVLEGIHQFVLAPRTKLTRCIYNIGAMAPSAQAIADTIAARLDHPAIRFEPDPTTVRLIESWPKQIDDSASRLDWGWAPSYDHNAMADHFLQELEREFTDQL